MKFKIKIDSVLNGMGASYWGRRGGSYLNGLAIDPGYGTSALMSKPSGAIMPVKYSALTTTTITAPVNWIITNPRDSKIYCYQGNGRLTSFSNVLTAETLAATATFSSGNGAAYYNDYLYLATDTDLSRYGTLSGGAPAITNNVWSGATLGALTLLTNTAYPANIPNHPMHAHVDNRLYFGDYANGQGMVHFVKTTYAGVNDGSTYNALDLPFGYAPTDIESYGNDLAILAIQVGTDNIIRQGKSALFLWDTFSESFYRQVDIQDSYATSMINDNGYLYIFHGSLNDMRMSVYAGGYTLQPLFHYPSQLTATAGTLDAMGSRIVFSGQYSESATGCVFARGYHSWSLPRDAVNNIMKSPSSRVSAVKLYKQDTGLKPRMLVGYTDDSSVYGVAAIDTTGGDGATFQSDYYEIGAPFDIQRVEYSLTGPIAAGTLIDTNMVIDANTNYASAFVQVSQANFPTVAEYLGGRQFIKQEPKGIMGFNGFQLGLTFNGSVSESVGVALPITIYGETKEGK